MNRFVCTLCIVFLLIFSSGCYTRLTVVETNESAPTLVQTEPTTVIYDDQFWYPRFGFYYYYPSPDYGYPDGWYHRWPHHHLWWSNWYWPPYPWYRWHSWHDRERPQNIRRFGSSRESLLGNPRRDLRETPREQKPNVPPRREPRIAPPERKTRPEEKRPPGIRRDAPTRTPRPENIRPADRPRDRDDTGKRKPDGMPRQRPRP